MKRLIEQVEWNHASTTAKKALEQGQVQKLLYLKGNTKGGVDGQQETLPIYLLEKYKF